MKRFLFPLAVAGLAVGCDGDAPMVTEPLAASFGVVQSGGSCRGVQGVIQSDANPAGAFGMVYGDVEGTITTAFGPDPVGNTGFFQTGRVIHLRGTQTVEVSGGIIPELVDETIVWTIESTVIHLPPIRRVSNTLTLIQGATGNLVSHGILDLTTLRADFDYEGVICVP